MAFNDVQKYSDWEDPTGIPFTEGMRTLQIIGAEYDEEGDIYRITFSDLETRAQFRVVYYLSYEGNPSTRVLGTLQTLKRALAGPTATKGILTPESIIGGVVCANVTSKVSDTGSKFARIYSYEPVAYEIALCAQIDQYYIGQEFEAPQE